MNYTVNKLDLTNRHRILMHKNCGANILFKPKKLIYTRP